MSAPHIHWIYGADLGAGIVAVFTLSAIDRKWVRVRAFNQQREEWNPPENLPRSQLIDLDPASPTLRVARRFVGRLKKTVELA
jgi:hypothetical protein